MTTNPSEPALCGLCGQPMPPGEQMFQYHGYSGPCPKVESATKVAAVDLKPAAPVAPEPPHQPGLLIVDLKMGLRHYHAEIKAGLNPDWFDRIVRAVDCVSEPASALSQLEAGWQPIATAPQDGKRVLLAPGFVDYACLDDEPTVVGYWDRDEEAEGGQCWRDVEIGDRFEPTHWRPLPRLGAD